MRDAGEAFWFCRARPLRVCAYQSGSHGGLPQVRPQGEISVLLLGIDGSDVDEQVAEGLATERAFDTTTFLGIDTAFRLSRSANRTQHRCLENLDGSEIAAPVV